jgi:6,7-dimethyl-8-ribityllumazine synthase
MAERKRPAERAVPRVKGKVLILEARYYEDVTDMLAAGATAVLEKAGVVFDRIAVPGAFEIPGAIKFALNMYDGFVALGCVVRGETSHYDYVCGECARGLMDLSLQHNVAIGFGVLTVENREQALRRADPKQLDKGGEAALACVRMVELKRRYLGGGHVA